ncbi:MAG TPA: hypothetical protein VEA37_02465 [Flavobacterium sp.]|nr:hypothetical protein [Flavobacterium sp.]
MRLKLILTTTILSGLFGHSYACKCNGPATVKESFKSSEVIVYGTVISADTVLLSETVKEKDAKEVKARLKSDKQKLRHFERTYVLKIELETIEKYKGDNLRKRVVIYTPLLGASCGYRFEQGKEYIVYGSKNNFLDFLFKKERKNKRYEKDNAFWTSHCTRTAEYIKSEADELKLLRSKRD